MTTASQPLPYVDPFAEKNPPLTPAPRIPHVIASDSLKHLLIAFAKAQAEFLTAIKDAANPFHKTHYADLNSVMHACMPALRTHGMVLFQPAHSDGEVVTVTTLLVHCDSGEYIGSALGCRPTPNTPQGVGSAITYARRYSLQSLVGLLADDDDGNAASGKNTKDDPRRPAPAAAPAPPPRSAAEAPAAQAQLTLVQRAKAALARIEARIGKEAANKEITEFKVGYTRDAKGRVVEAQQESYVKGLERMASGDA